nr:hypothetical protein [Candidatus Sigynarchaeota archaeon]
MDKVKLMAMLPGILGLLGVALPANISTNTADAFVFWMFGSFINDEGLQFLNMSHAPYLWLFPVSAIVLLAGTMLFFIAAKGVVKFGKCTWLPGLLMVAGIALYVIMAGPATEWVILGTLPIPFGLACGVLGAVWALYVEIKAIRSVK